MLVLIKYWDAFLVGAVSLLSFYLVSIFSSVYGLLSASVAWAVVAFGLFYNRYNKEEKITDLKRYIISILFTILGFLGSYLLIEWVSVRWFLAILGSICIGGVYVASDKLNLSRIAEYKPWRRMFMMLIVFDSFLILASLFGLSVFFNEALPFWSLAFTGSVFVACSSLVIWQLYYDKQLKELLLWVILVAIIIFELMWVVQLLPFGYLVSGLIITWIWYILQLFIRFHISERGIIWDKQKFFLTGNAVLFIIFLYFVRWI